MQTCCTREQLRQYLEGWADETQSEEIESHLSQCSDCEKSVVSVEAEIRNGIGVSGKAESASQPAQWLDETIQAIKTFPNAVSNHANEPLLQGDFGNYEILERIGRGGMAEVYRARHKRLNRDVALKLTRVPECHLEESLQRIEREMRVIGHLRHRAIVNALDAGEHEGVQFLVTEFIDGLDVSKIARSVEIMPSAEACAIVRFAALGMEHAHEAGIVHRDVKPSNLMLDRNGEVKILDFGLAQTNGWTGISAEVTTVGQLLGTLDYMSPEQAERADLADNRSDVYSLGATLFRLLSGRAPYASSPHQSALEKLRLLANTQPPRLRTLRPDLPEELASLVDAAIERDPQRRPASAALFAEALAPFCEGADLKRLVESALEVDSDCNSARQPYRELKNVEIVSAAKATTNESRQPPARRWPWLIGFAALFGALWLGVVIVLETQKGTVVIESDSADVHIQLVSGDDVRQEIELVPGENSTRVYAGEYEIRIGDGSDRYTIENGKFTLRRGERVVAQVSVDSEAKKAQLELQQSAESEWIPTNSTSRTLEAYVVEGDVNLANRIVQTMLSSEDDVRVEVDPNTNKLIVYGTELVHHRVADTLKAIAEPSAKVSELNIDYNELREATGEDSDSSVDKSIGKYNVLDRFYHSLDLSNFDHTESIKNGVSCIACHEPSKENGLDLEKHDFIDFDHAFVMKEASCVACHMPGNNRNQKGKNLIVEELAPKILDGTSWIEVGFGKEQIDALALELDDQGLIEILEGIDTRLQTIAANEPLLTKIRNEWNDQWQSNSIKEADDDREPQRFYLRVFWGRNQDIQVVIGGCVHKTKSAVVNLLDAYACLARSKPKLAAKFPVSGVGAVLSKAQISIQELYKQHLKAQSFRSVRNIGQPKREKGTFTLTLSDPPSSSLVFNFSNEGPPNAFPKAVYEIESGSVVDLYPSILCMRIFALKGITFTHDGKCIE
ncbi:MAG: protein kinase [Pirellulaceae bacterium]